MGTKELKITIPEGYEIDKDKSTFEKIVFKKKGIKPRSWKEYCHTRLDSKETRFGYTIKSIYHADWDNSCNCSTWRNVLPTKELAEAFLAMMQLMSLRQAWIGDWRPDWKDHTQFKANTLCLGTGFTIAYFKDLNSRPLSFPTEEMAKNFMDCFKDLLEIAKPLI